jgi:hypothetical protein
MVLGVSMTVRSQNTDGRVWNKDAATTGECGKGKEQSGYVIRA